MPAASSRSPQERSRADCQGTKRRDCSHHLGRSARGGRRQSSIAECRGTDDQSPSFLTVGALGGAFLALQLLMTRRRPDHASSLEPAKGRE